MTSMPASRSARAMIFAPRSCPSRPALAMTTRIFLAIACEYRGVRLTVIGCSPAWPNPGGAPSGDLPDRPGPLPPHRGPALPPRPPARAPPPGPGPLLLDCGPGVLARLRERGHLAIDAIAITHFHLDHWGDLVPWAWLAAHGRERPARPPPPPPPRASAP